ncbi:hypothetical protein SEPCBS57363_000852 [Sporothrix epigloea]|uniref:Cysteine-rich transmembrane CYSTM domain-containing protein n=1 Tax=Sporothrix epigloea TaxID=1892477 RepID=A0ABP0D725_9PEZI
MDAPARNVDMALPAKNAEPATEQPTRVEPMSVEANMRGGDEAEEVCCGVCAGLACFECCKCCC